MVLAEIVQLDASLGFYVCSHKKPFIQLLRKSREILVRPWHLAGSIIWHLEENHLNLAGDSPKKLPMGSILCLGDEELKQGLPSNCFSCWAVPGCTTKNDQLSVPHAGMITWGGKGGNSSEMGIWWVRTRGGWKGVCNLDFVWTGIKREESRGLRAWNGGRW